MDSQSTNSQPQENSSGVLIKCSETPTMGYASLGYIGACRGESQLSVYSNMQMICSR